MDSSEDKWAKFHEKALSYEQAIAQEPFRTLIQVIESFVSQHKLDLIVEIGFGTGYTMIALSKELHKQIVGIDISETLVERTKKLAEEKGADVEIVQADVFSPEAWRSIDVKKVLLYHQGLLEHFPNEKIQEILEAEVKNSFAMIFSVPSKFYGKQDFGDERLLTLEEWKEILEPFEVYQLRYYDNNKHILGILKGGFYGEPKRA